jgi:hypothetical protein
MEIEEEADEDEEEEDDDEEEEESFSSEKRSLSAQNGPSSKRKARQTCKLQNRAKDGLKARQIFNLLL